jgi:hypothetical protein
MSTSQWLAIFGGGMQIASAFVHLIRTSTGSVEGRGFSLLDMQPLGRAHDLWRGKVGHAVFDSPADRVDSLILPDIAEIGTILFGLGVLHIALGVIAVLMSSWIATTRSLVVPALLGLLFATVSLLWLDRRISGGADYSLAGGWVILVAGHLFVLASALIDRKLYRDFLRTRNDSWQTS